MPPRPQPVPRDVVDQPPAERGPTGPVPEANQPGHRPTVEQDKPRRPFPVPEGSILRTSTSSFRFDWPTRLASALAGAVPPTTEVEVGETHLRIRYGMCSVRTDLTNVADVEVTGPYAWAKVGGPPRLSLRDRGLTLATTTAGGTCIRFHRPVRGVDLLGLVRHPAVTVTVEEPRALSDEIQAAVRRVR